MPTLWGTSWTRAELLRRVGRLDQVAGVRQVELADGLGRGVRLLEFRTGSGLSFDVVVDRAFDIGRAEFRGQALNWTSNAGVVGPWFYEAFDWGWFRAWGGGLLVTCGLDHTMSPATDTAAMYRQEHMFTTVDYGLHGRVGGIPARLVGYGERWDGDDCVLWAEGEVLQSAVFGEQLLLRRRIEARVGLSEITVHDVVENVGHQRTPTMLLYHCNLGFPLVDAGSELIIPTVAVTTDPWATIDGYSDLTAPQPDFTEACFYHVVGAEPDGSVPVALVNRRLGMGFIQVFDRAQLPEFMVWRQMGEGTYAVALEPGTNRAVARADLRASKEIAELGPGEQRVSDLRLGVLDGPDEIDAAARRIEAIR
jgi:hypothetical protein